MQLLLDQDSLIPLPQMLLLQQLENELFLHQSMSSLQRLILLLLMPRKHLFQLYLLRLGHVVLLQLAPQECIQMNLVQAALVVGLLVVGLVALGYLLLLVGLRFFAGPKV